MLRLFTWPVVLATLVLRVQAQDLQDCYAYDKEVQSDNVVCEGSGACCNAEATCTEQRLCHNKDDPPNVFVRGPCSSRSWDPSICPQLCLYSEGANNFPRVTQCSDGSWCCHDQANVNSTTCCDYGQGTFLNERGEVMDEPPASTTSVAPSTVPIASATTNPSASVSASATPTPVPEDGLSTGAKIGIGVGVGGGVLFLIGAGLIGWFFLKRSRQAREQQQQQERLGGPKEPLHSHGYDEMRPHYADHEGQYRSNEYYKPLVESPPAEAPGSIPGRMYSDHGRVEADTGHVVGELPAEVPRSGSTEKP